MFPSIFYSSIESTGTFLPTRCGTNFLLMLYNLQFPWRTKTFSVIFVYVWNSTRTGSFQHQLKTVFMARDLLSKHVPLFLQKVPYETTSTKMIFYASYYFFLKERTLNWQQFKIIKTDTKDLKMWHSDPKDPDQHFLGIAGSGSEYNDHGSATMIQLCIFSQFTQI